MREKQEKLWNSEYIKVMLANFNLFFAFYLLTPLLPLYLSEHFFASKDVIGFVLSGYVLAALIFRPFSGYIVDSFNRKKVLVLCFLIYSVCFAGYLLASSLVLFAIIRTLHGSPFGACTVANSTVAIDVLPSSRRNEGIGFYGLSNNIASALAPTIGVFIYKYTKNFDILFWLAIVFALIDLISAYSIKIPQKEIIKNTNKISLDRFFLLKGWFLALNMVFFSFCYGVLSNYLAIYSKETLGITTGTGTYFMLLSLGLILSRLQGNKALKEGKLLQNAFIGIVISTFGYVIFAFFPTHFLYYLSALLIGLGNGHMYPAFQNMIIKVANHNERGTANSTLLTSWDVGVGIGILAGGFIAEHFSYYYAFILVALVHVLGLSLYYIFTRKRFVLQYNKSNLTA
ncbi:MAG: MFS transporter [Bacteroidota bacterium]|nr:MFS transporter [Bacteroidota bacterium]